MTDRRYDDQEVEAIFRVAASGRIAESQRPQSGLTLAQLQQAGLEAGLAPEAVAMAAAALELRGTSSVRRWIGLPIGVSHTVELGRTLSDSEWDRFVSRLRDVFDAHGKTGIDGSARFWRNGQLRVMLEPSNSGHRLRFRTTNENAQGLITVGFALLSITAVGVIATLSKGTITHAAGALLPIGLVGSVITALGAARVPKWARLRASQMETLGNEAAKPG